MQSLLDRLRVVVLEAPYDRFHSPEVQRLLCETLQVKLQSYQKVYPQGVLPLDTYDFISTHHLVGWEASGQFQPLMVFRTITLDRCDHHRVAFPGMAVLRGSGANAHADALELKLHEWRSRQEIVSYGSGWAITPHVPLDRETRNVLKDLMTAMLVNHEEAQGTTQLVACGTARVHTDEYFQNIGYRRMAKEDGSVLAPFPQASLIGTDAVLLQAEAFNARARELAWRHRSLWNRREIFTGHREKIAA